MPPCMPDRGHNQHHVVRVGLMNLRLVLEKLHCFFHTGNVSMDATAYTAAHYSCGSSVKLNCRLCRALCLLHLLVCIIKITLRP